MIQDLLSAAAYWLVAYAGLGALFAVYFVAWGATRFDQGHNGSSFAARAILVPGVIALWPILLFRMLGGFKFQG